MHKVIFRLGRIGFAFANNQANTNSFTLGTIQFLLSQQNYKQTKLAFISAKKSSLSSLLKLHFYIRFMTVSKQESAFVPLAPHLQSCRPPGAAAPPVLQRCWRAVGVGRPTRCAARPGGACRRGGQG